MGRLLRGIALAVPIVVFSSPHHTAHASFVNFESQHVHPIALSPSGNRLAVVNTPDARLGVFAAAS